MKLEPSSSILLKYSEETSAYLPSYLKTLRTLPSSCQDLGDPYVLTLGQTGGTPLYEKEVALTSGTSARTRGQASGLTIFFVLLLGSLGGAWWPLEIPPQPSNRCSKCCPRPGQCWDFKTSSPTGNLSTEFCSKPGCCWASRGCSS